MTNKDQKPTQNPSPREQVGTIRDTDTQKDIPVVPRTHESPAHAIERAVDKHVDKAGDKSR